MSGNIRARLQNAKEDVDSAANTGHGSLSIPRFGSRAPYTSPTIPNSAFHIRNRYLSKVGEKVAYRLFGLQ